MEEPFRRCDACVARAYVYVDMNGTELAYCGSHATRYLPKLTENAQVIVDLRHTIPA